MPASRINSFDYQVLKDSSLGERLKFMRLRMGELYSPKDYTTTAIAKNLGVSPQAITKVERGESKNPSFLLIHNVSKLFNVPIETFTDEFYEGEVTLFSIGYPDQIEVDFDLDDIDKFEVVKETNDNADQYKVNETDHGEPPSAGVLVYQLFRDNKMKVVYRNESIHNIDSIDFIKFLSRIVNETDLQFDRLSLNSLEKVKDSNPIKKAADLYKRALTDSSKVPLISKQVFERALENGLGGNA